MNFTASSLSYRQTRSFSKIVEDYLENDPALQPFYAYPVSVAGVEQAIQEQSFPGSREILVEHLRRQYEGITDAGKVQEQISLLLDKNTYTVCTAHQPNIFTGHLYFIYKILHAIKLSEELNAKVKGSRFVPVYYMGSEDADLEELGQVSLEGKQYRWDTKQTGAVGRMKVDQPLVRLIDEMQAQLSVLPYGNEAIALLRDAYITGSTIEQATFKLVHTLFGKYGLVILLPDAATLKNIFIPVMRKELETGFSHKAVTATMKDFSAAYTLQAAGREINLFYLKEGLRERIEANEDVFSVVNTDIRFTRSGILEELEAHPERFSPNVILRPVYQQYILPNVAFIGGGGELAYWLELKKVHAEVKAPFPVLVLRNSFLLVRKTESLILKKLGLNKQDVFIKENELLKKVITAASSQQLTLDKEKQELQQLYDHIKAIAAAVDPTLSQHLSSLHVQADKKLRAVEKKMMSAAIKKEEAITRQVKKLRAAVFPGGTLQERVDNYFLYHALYGSQISAVLYDHSNGLQQVFSILEEK